MTKDYHQLILKYFKLSDDKIINIYLFGSQIYKTANYKSDHDFMIVVKQNYYIDDIKKINGININICNELSFINHLNRHRMSILEYIFLLLTKSIFHAFRTLDFAIQIINNDKIINYCSANKWLSNFNCDSLEEFVEL
jgi:hypothetical protein